MPYIITKRHLDAIDACSKQKNAFIAQFGDEVDITVVDRQLLKGYDWDWYAKKVLKDTELLDYRARRKPIDEDYWAKLKPLDDDYQAERKLLNEDYWAKRKLIDEDYQAKRKLIGDDYWAKHKPINDEHNLACLELFLAIKSKGE